MCYVGRFELQIGYTVLMFAALNDRVDSVRVLLDGGADTEAVQTHVRVLRNFCSGNVAFTQYLNCH